METIKAKVFYVPINSQGYTSCGTYYGVGAPLYRIISENDEIIDEVRTYTREQAAHKFIKKYKNDYILKIKGVNNDEVS